LFVKNGCLIFSQGTQGHDFPEDAVSIAKEEKKRIDHHTELDKKDDHVLCQIGQVDKDIIGNAFDALGELFSNELLIHLKFFHGGVAGQEIQDILDFIFDGARVRADGIINLNRFGNEQTPNDRGGEDNNQDDQEKHQGSAEIRAVQLFIESLIKGGENAGNHRGPENGGEKRFQDIEKQEGDETQYNKKNNILNLFRIHGTPVFRSREGVPFLLVCSSTKLSRFNQSLF
jgi:hypothetical protein